VVSYRITVTCESGLLQVKTHQKRWESDQEAVEGDAGDDFLGESWIDFDFDGLAGT
jgi:hypothetical protein